MNSNYYVLHLKNKIIYVILILLEFKKHSI